MSEFKEVPVSTKYPDELIGVKVPEKIIHKLDGLIKESEIVLDLLSPSVHRLGGDLPPKTGDGSKKPNAWPELTGDCFLLSLADKISRLEELQDSIRVYVNRLNELI